MSVARWAINAYIFGIPFTLYCFIAMIWNLFINIKWNKLWAEGNLFLLANTLYLFIQINMSLNLAFEVPFVMKMIKPFRVISFMSAVVYTAFFYGTAFEWVYQLLAEDKNDFETSGYFGLFINMVLIYNIIFHAPVIPINIFIILKELTLPWF